MGTRIAIDANLLLLLVVGEANLDWIATHKRLRAYDCDAFELLSNNVGDISRLITTPNVLTEVSNLSCQGMNEAACGRIRIVLAELIKHSTEEYVDSRTAVERKEFARLGLTDAVLLASAHVNVALWTDDHDLYLAALRQKTPFVNFTHLRRSRGLL